MASWLADQVLYSNKDSVCESGAWKKKNWINSSGVEKEMPQAFAMMGFVGLYFFFFSFFSTYINLARAQ